MAARQVDTVSRLVVLAPTLRPALRRPLRWLRMLNLISYTFCSVPRALSTGRFAVLEEMEGMLGQIPAPTLVVRAGRDPLSSTRWVRRLVELLSDGRSARLDRRSHTAFYLAPDAVAEVVGPFLAAPQATPGRTC